MKISGRVGRLAAPILVACACLGVGSGAKAQYFGPPVPIYRPYVVPAYPVVAPPIVYGPGVLPPPIYGPYGVRPFYGPYPPVVYRPGFYGPYPYRRYW